MSRSLLEIRRMEQKYEEEELLKPFLKYASTEEEEKQLEVLQAAKQSITNIGQAQNHETRFVHTLPQVQSRLKKTLTHNLPASSVDYSVTPKDALIEVNSEMFECNSSNITGSSNSNSYKYNDTTYLAYLPVPVLRGTKTDALIALGQMFARYNNSSNNNCKKDNASHKPQVSVIPSSRDDVIALHAALEERLQQRRALQTGICAIRREIYNDVFHELIRQVTLEEPVRGVLLRHVKDYYDHALLVHADLHQRGNYYASHELSNSLNGISVLEERVKVLETEKQEMLRHLHSVEERQKKLEKDITDTRVRRSKEQQDELAYLRKSNQQLSLRLKAETERTSLTTNNVNNNTVITASSTTDKTGNV